MRNNKKQTIFIFKLQVQSTEHMKFSLSEAIILMISIEENILKLSLMILKRLLTVLGI